MTSPNLGLVTTDLAAQDVFDILATLIPDLLTLDEALGGLSGSANLLANPGFEINQRGAASYVGNAAFTVDRWQISYNGAVALTVVPTTFSPAPSFSAGSVRCEFVRGAGTAATLEQLIEPWALYKGATLAFSLWVSCATQNAVQLVIGDGVGSSFSAFHPGGGWQRMTVTRTLDAAATTLKVGAYFAADCTAWVDSATLALGSTPLPYAPLRSEEDLRRCQRSYEVQGGAAGHPVLAGVAAGAGQVWTFSWPWVVHKGGTPTVTRTGTWVVLNCGQPAVSPANSNGFSLSVTSVAAGAFSAEPGSADDQVVAEWNAT